MVITVDSPDTFGAVISLTRPDDVDRRVDVLASRREGTPTFVSLMIKNGREDIYLNLTPAQAVEVAEMLQRAAS